MCIFPFQVAVIVTALFVQRTCTKLFSQCNQHNFFRNVSGRRLPSQCTCFCHNHRQRLSLADLFFFSLWRAHLPFVCCIMLWKLLCPPISAGNSSAIPGSCLLKQTVLSHPLQTLPFATCRHIPWLLRQTSLGEEASLGRYGEAAASWDAFCGFFSLVFARVRYCLTGSCQPPAWSLCWWLKPAPLLYLAYNYLFYNTEVLDTQTGVGQSATLRKYFYFSECVLPSWETWDVLAGDQSTTIPNGDIMFYNWAQVFPSLEQ